MPFVNNVVAEVCLFAQFSKHCWTKIHCKYTVAKVLFLKNPHNHVSFYVEIGYIANYIAKKFFDIALKMY
jgi:hypothetical protein